MQQGRVLTLIAVLLLATLGADSADAQRRRRRRPPPPPTEQTPPAPQEGADGGAIGDNPFGESAQAAPAPQGQPPGAAQAGEQGTTPPAAGGEGAAATPERATEEGAIDEYGPIGPDLAPLRAEYTSIMDELVNVRSRMSVLGRQLFRTKVLVRVHNRAGDDNTLARLVISLDGAPVHRGDGSQLGEDARKVFEGFAAPGPHVLTVEVEQRQRANDDYRYTTRDAFRFQVQREQLTEIDVILDDDSDMGEDFEDDGEAEYDVNTRVRVATRELRD